jgi:hypothetical protein
MLDKMSPQLDMVRSQFSNDVITGSLALNLYELIYRDISDIDIIINDSTRYIKYMLNCDSDLDNCNLGYKVMSYKRNIFSRSKILK